VPCHTPRHCQTSASRQTLIYTVNHKNVTFYFWPKYKNRSRLTKVIFKNKMSRFLWFTVYNKAVLGLLGSKRGAWLLLWRNSANTERRIWLAGCCAMKNAADFLTERGSGHPKWAWHQKIRPYVHAVQIELNITVDTWRVHTEKSLSMQSTAPVLTMKMPNSIMQEASHIAEFISSNSTGTSFPVTSP